MIGFKKIASVLTSAVMITSTIGFAAAASYPAPFVVDGLADGAVVYGANAAISDVTAAINVQQKLGTLATSGSKGTEGSVTGEAAELFSGGTKIYVNDSMNVVKTVITKTELPTVLADESFSGVVDSKLTQVIDVGSNPKVTFKKQPTNSDDPSYALELGSTSTNYMYNATITFSKAIDFNNASSEGEEIMMFGQKYTVASATDGTNLVLLQSAEKLTLDSDNPSADVTIAGSVYTVELVSASDTAATIKVTDSSGNSNSREINEAASKKVQGITIAVTNADETNLKLSASVIAGSEKITMASGSSVTVGEDDTVIDGTNAVFTGGTTAMTKLSVAVFAPNSDSDAIKSGESFVDPVFKTFKLDFAGMNIADDATTREVIEVRNSGDDKMELVFNDHRGKATSFVFASNHTNHGGMALSLDETGVYNFTREMEMMYKNEYVVVGNEDEGYLLKLSTVTNQTTGYNNDKISFTDAISGDTIEATLTAEGTGTLSVGGKSYTVTYNGTAGNSETTSVYLDFPDSTGQNMVAYPTIQSGKGAKIALYEPLTIKLNDWDGGKGNTLAGIRFPDGDGYTDVTLTYGDTVAGNDVWNVTVGSTVTQFNTSIGTNGDSSTTVAIGRITYNFSSTGTANETKLMLHDTGGNPIKDQPALVIFEERDDNTNYEALIVTLEAGATGDDGIGISDVERTWSADLSTWEATLASDSKVTKEGDLWGTIISRDSSDSDQTTAIISYPDEQIYAQLYFAEVAAAITPGKTGTSGGGQVMIVTDNEVNSVSGKNLFVVGGSCINSVAAKILGSDSPLCTTDFTEKTQAGPGQYIIKSVVSPYSDNKIALLVAGYEAADTKNAVDKALEGVNTDKGTSQVYPITG